MTRYPLGPLAALVHLSPWTTLERAGITGSHAQDFIRRGMSARVADRVAVRHGFLPYEVWPEILDAAIADLERSCAAVGCDRAFVPAPNQRFCSPSCRQRMKMRRYRSDPVRAERHRQERRRYYHECESVEARRRRERVG